MRDVTFGEEACRVSRPKAARIRTTLCHLAIGRYNLELQRCYKGGVRLKRPASSITLLEISEAIDGRKWLGRCLLGLEECTDARACPTHAFWKQTRASIEEKLRKTTLANVVAFEAQRQSSIAKVPDKSLVPNN